MRHLRVILKARQTVVTSTVSNMYIYPISKTRVRFFPTSPYSFSSSTPIPFFFNASGKHVKAVHDWIL